MRVKVPMRGTGTDHPVVVMKSRNWDGAKGMDQLVERASQPVIWEERISLCVCLRS
jgi:hypothetical protein